MAPWWLHVSKDYVVITQTLSLLQVLFYFVLSLADQEKSVKSQLLALQTGWMQSYY